MAEPVLKTQKFLQVVLADGVDKETTFNIDNPRNDLTRASVEAAFNYIFASHAETQDSGVNWLYNNDYQPIITFKAASIETVTKVTEVLE